MVSSYFLAEEFENVWELNWKQLQGITELKKQLMGELMQLYLRIDINLPVIYLTGDGTIF